MSEEEIIKYTKNIINATYIEATLQDKEGNIIEQGFVNKDVIQGLLDLYDKEKEWNNTLLDSLNECGFQAVEMVKDINKKYIPKSKIEEKIEELENSEPSDDDYNFEVQNDIHSKIDILQELLEEE